MSLYNSSINGIELSTHSNIYSFEVKSYLNVEISLGSDQDFIIIYSFIFLTTPTLQSKQELRRTSNISETTFSIHILS